MRSRREMGVPETKNSAAKASVLKRDPAKRSVSWVGRLHHLRETVEASALP